MRCTHLLLTLTLTLTVECIMILSHYDVAIVSRLDTYSDIYTTVGPALMICQMLAVLEIVHPLLRWVRTGVIMPIMQVSQSTDNAIVLL